jgi:hypothetical protein
MSECLLVQLSTERQYSGDSYFREQGFCSNKFTWHFPMDPKACLYYPSQPGVTQTFSQVSLTMQRFLSQWVGIAVPQGILTATFSAGPVHGSPGMPSGCREKGHAHKWLLPLYQGLEGDSDSMVSDGKEVSKALGSSLSLYNLWWSHHFCYPDCHLRFGLLAYQLVTLQLVSKS